MLGTMCSWAGAIALAVAGQNAQVPEAQSCGSITVVVPRDAWRLSVEADGSARINFAALPQTASAPAGTFEFRKLHSDLASTVSPTEVVGRSGTVEFKQAADGKRVLRYLKDEGHAGGLFEQAWAHVTMPSDQLGRHQVQKLREMWDRRDSPRRR